MSEDATRTIPPETFDIDHYPEALFATTSEGIVLAWNRASERLYHTTRDEAVGRDIFALVVPPEAQPGAREQLALALSSGHAAQATTRIKKSGATIHVESTLQTVEPSGAPRFVAWCERAFEPTRFAALLLDAAPDGMVVADSAGKIVLVNGQVERMFGYSRLELLGQPVELLVPHRFHSGHLQHRKGYTADPRVRAMGEGMKLFARRKDGSEMPVEISLSPLELEHETLVTAAIRDMSERRRLEDARSRAEEQATRQALEASRLKGEFLANMSHELRTPLNAIIGFAELMHDGRVGPVSDQHREYLGDILTSSRHLLMLINGVLDLAKVEAGRMEFHAEPVRAALVLGEVRDMMRSMAKDGGIRLEVEVDPDVPELFLDPARLKQVLYNFLSNALKFTPSGGRVSLRLVRHDATRFRIEVEDSGIGIQPTDLPRLFVEFQQLDASMAKAHSGTGLGLALTRRIVEAQGGEVGVQSTPGKGSLFSAILPYRITLASDGSDGAPPREVDHGR